MITNKFYPINSNIIAAPLIARSNSEGWIPTFKLWTTTVNDGDGFIDCTQNFSNKLKNYAREELDSEIGYYHGDTLIIRWKALIDSEDIESVNAAFKGRMRAVNWQKRYCTYFNAGSKTPWLHSVVLNHSTTGQVVHHINGVSIDNRKRNLHILPKKEHDSINHAKLDERQKMFENPESYWKTRKALAIEDFVTELGLIVMFDYKIEFLMRFAEDNLPLLKDILEYTKLNINLNRVKYHESENRRINKHLSNDYLDTYEIEKYLRRTIPKSSPGQLRLL